MACYADKVVATAIGEIGTKETGTNVNKYARYIDKNFPNFYNTPKQGAEWCDVFADYCVLVNCADDKEAEYVLCQPEKSCGAGCRFSYDYYKQKCRTGKEPRIGAQVFFGTEKPKHTGIVVEVNAESFVTVEGNSDNMVKRHTYKKSSSKIYGFGYPRYTEEQSSEPAKPVEPEKKVAKYQIKTNSGVPLRLREKPNTNCKVLVLMKNGAIIDVDETANGWAHATYNGQVGWCSMTYLKKV